MIIFLENVVFPESKLFENVSNSSWVKNTLLWCEVKLGMMPSQWEHACFATDRAIDSNGVAVKKKVILMIISHYIHSGFLKYRLGSNSLNSVGDKFNDFSVSTATKPILSWAQLTSLRLFLLMSCWLLFANLPNFHKPAGHVANSSRSPWNSCCCFWASTLCQLPAGCAIFLIALRPSESQHKPVQRAPASSRSVSSKSPSGALRKGS